jgi:hypothetical protein
MHQRADSDGVCAKCGQKIQFGDLVKIISRGRKTLMYCTREKCESSKRLNRKTKNLSKAAKNDIFRCGHRQSGDFEKGKRR